MRLVFLFFIFGFCNLGCTAKTKEEKVTMDSKSFFHSIAEFKKQISSQLTPSRTREIFGPPERDLASGLYRYEYTVKEGGSIILSFDSKLREATYHSAESSEILYRRTNTSSDSQ